MAAIAERFYVSNTEIFRIRSIDRSQNLDVYLLDDLEKRPFEGIFSCEELVQTVLPEFFPVTMLRMRKKNVCQAKKNLVPWIGYPDREWKRKRRRRSSSSSS